MLYFAVLVKTIETLVGRLLLAISKLLFHNFLALSRDDVCLDLRFGHLLLQFLGLVVFFVKESLLCLVELL